MDIGSHQKVSDPTLLNELFNAHLIQNGLRRAYFKSPSTEITMKDEILKMYPKLKLSNEKYSTWWLSKRKILPKYIDTGAKIGHVLGYRNKVPIDERDWNSRGYFFRIKVYLKDGTIVSITQASDATLDFKDYYEDLATKFEKCLKEMPVYGPDIKKVVSEIEIEYPSSEIIEMMTNYKKKYNKDPGLKNSIKKYMPKELETLIKTLDLDNELHRGIIIGLKSVFTRPFMSAYRSHVPLKDRQEYLDQTKNLLEIEFTELKT